MKPAFAMQETAKSCGFHEEENDWHEYITND